MCLSGSQSCQKAVLAILANSGVASLHSLTEVWPAPAGHPQPPESGNNGIRLLASAEGPKVTIAVSASWSEGSGSGARGGMVANSARRAPPIKVAGGQNQASVEIPGMRILYWF